MTLKIVRKLSILFKNIFFSLFITTSIVSFSQNQKILTKKTKSPTVNITESEILKKAKDFISKKEYDSALLLFSKYYDNFSESLGINWLYAYVLSLNKYNKKANVKFKKAISLAPLDKNLQMDYARFLYQTGNITQLEIILSKFMNEDSENVEFLLMQANLNYWKGDIENANKKIRRIQELYPNTEITNNLSEQIRQLSSIYLIANFEYQTDTQPLNYSAYHTTISKFESRFLNPQLEISEYNFSSKYKGALIIKLSNKFSFNKLKLTTNISGGLYKSSSGEDDWLGAFSVHKKLNKNVTLNLGYSKNYLISTIASTKFNLTQQDLLGSIDYSNNWLNLQGGYNNKFFKDNNSIKSYYSWILSQPVKFKKIEFQIGYSYNYTDSKNVLFIFNEEGTGVYDPYFTPKEQEVHAGLLIVNYRPTKKLIIEGKMNYGFIASLSNPYPIQLTATKFEIGGFYDETFSPLEVVGTINYSFSNRFTTKLTYTDQETFFYRRKNINIGLNFIF